MATEVLNAPVLASLNHLSDLVDYKVERPYEIWLDEVPHGLEQTNVKFELQHDIPIIDARSVGLDHFDIELHGFEFLKQRYPAQCVISGADSANASEEQRSAILEYIRIMSDFLCEKYGGVMAVCYDWRVRSIWMCVFAASGLITYQVRRSRHSPVNKIPQIYTLPDEADARKITIDVAHQVHAGKFSR